MVVLSRAQRKALACLLCVAALYGGEKAEFTRDLNTCCHKLSIVLSWTAWHVVCTGIPHGHFNHYKWHL
jgi:hypothetical protein